MLTQGQAQAYPRNLFSVGGFQPIVRLEDFVLLFQRYAGVAVLNLDDYVAVLLVCR